MLALRRGDTRDRSTLGKEYTRSDWRRIYEKEIQSTLAITIRVVTIAWLKRFDVMESIIF